jgi:hypothetical protein
MFYNKQNVATASLYEQVQTVDGSKATYKITFFESQKVAVGTLQRAKRGKDITGLGHGA